MRKCRVANNLFLSLFEIILFPSLEEDKNVIIFPGVSSDLHLAEEILTNKLRDSNLAKHTPLNQRYVRFRYPWEPKDVQCTLYAF